MTSDWPGPIEAIRFRMDQAGLMARDLIPMLGSRVKVSEVLSGKRSLSLQMIRALHEHLRIPAEVLLRQPGGSRPEMPLDLDWSFELEILSFEQWTLRFAHFQGGSSDCVPRRV